MFGGLGLQRKWRKGLQCKMKSLSRCLLFIFFKIRTSKWTLLWKELFFRSDVQVPLEPPNHTCISICDHFLPNCISVHYYELCFLDVIMADLDYKLLSQWVIGVWGHILSWEFHKINPVLAKGTCIQSWRSWWFHEVYGPSGTRWRTSCREPLSQRKDTMQMCSCWTSGVWE